MNHLAVAVAAKVEAVCVIDRRWLQCHRLWKKEICWSSHGVKKLLQKFFQQKFP
jgi:hypothetical protein